MSIFLLTRPAGDGADRAGRRSLPTSWLEVALRWIDERLAEVSSADPTVDFVRLGQGLPEDAVASAMVTRLSVRPRVRNRRDDQDDAADVQLAVTCMAGMDLMRADPFAASRVAGLVWGLLDEWHRTDVALVGAGEARSITIRMNRAIVEDDDPRETPALRLPSVMVDAGMIQSSVV